MSCVSSLIIHMLWYSTVKTTTRQLTQTASIIWLIGLIAYRWRRGRAAHLSEMYTWAHLSNSDARVHMTDCRTTATMTLWRATATLQSTDKTRRAQHADTLLERTQSDHSKDLTHVVSCAIDCEWSIDILWYVVDLVHLAVSRHIDEQTDSRLHFTQRGALNKKLSWCWQQARRV